MIFNFFWPLSGVFSLSVITRVVVVGCNNATVQYFERQYLGWYLIAPRCILVNKTSWSRAGKGSEHSTLLRVRPVLLFRSSRFNGNNTLLRLQRTIGIRGRERRLQLIQIIVKPAVFHPLDILLSSTRQTFRVTARPILSSLIVMTLRCNCSWLSVLRFSAVIRHSSPNVAVPLERLLTVFVRLDHHVCGKRRMRTGTTGVFRRGT